VLHLQTQTTARLRLCIDMSFYKASDFKQDVTEKEATTVFKEGAQRFEKTLIAACRCGKFDLPSPPSLGGALNALTRHPSPFGRSLQETLYKILRYRNQCVHDGIILPVALVREYLVAMDETASILDGKGLLPAYLTERGNASEPAGNSAVINDLDSEDAGSDDSDDVRLAQYPASEPPGSTAARPPAPLALALTATGAGEHGGNGYSSVDTILAAAMLAARGVFSVTAWAVTTTTTVVSGAIVGGMSSGAVAAATGGPAAAITSAVPGSIGGMATASLNVAASAATTIGAYGAHLGSRLWVGAATVIGNTMTKGSEVVETSVVSVRLPRSGKNDSYAAAAAAPTVAHPVAPAFDAL